MRKRSPALRTLFLIVAVVLFVGSTSAFAQGPPIENPDPGGDGSSGGCSYCGQSHCGCDALCPPGYRTAAWECTCSSLQCTQSCSFVPA